MSSKAVRKPKSEGLTAKGEVILFIKPPTDGWPKASKRKGSDNYEAKGIDPETGKRKSYYDKDPEKASKKAAKSLGLLDYLPDSTLHGIYVTSYWPSVRPRSYNWREQIRWAYDGFIGPKWGGYDLADLKRNDIQNWFNDLIGKLENSSLRKIRIVMSCIINHAMDDDDCQISRNPCARIKLPAVEDPEKTALTPRELRKLIECAQGREIPIVLLGAMGLRKGEICGVQADRIQKGDLVVNQQVQYEKGLGFFLTPKLKTPQSKRTIPLPQDFKERLVNAGQVSDIFIASDSLGGFVTPKNVDRELASAVGRAGIPRISPHELRHTFITILENELEAPDTIVAKLAGRAKKGLNAGYSHSTLILLRKWTEKYWDHVMNAVSDECPLGFTTEAVVN